MAGILYCFLRKEGLQKMHTINLCYGMDAVCECASLTKRTPGMITFLVGKERTGKSTLYQLEANQVLEQTSNHVIFVNPSDNIDYSYFEENPAFAGRVKVITEDLTSSIVEIAKETLLHSNVIRWVYIDYADPLTPTEQEKLYFLCQIAKRKNLIITILLNSMKAFKESGKYPYVMWSYLRNYIITELDDNDAHERDTLFYLTPNQLLYQYASNSKEWNTFENIGRNGIIVDHTKFIYDFEQKKHSMRRIMI